jgi:hypothetical protein
MNTLESYITDNPLGKSDTCAKFVIDDTSMPFVLHNITSANQEYTMSFWVKADAEGILNVSNATIDVTTEWTKRYVTFYAYDVNMGFLFSTVGTYYIYHPKLEVGNKATDWTPAPEDVDAKIDDVETIVSQKIIEQKTSIISDTEQIILSALKSYISTSDYDSYKETVSSQLSLMADEIRMTFESSSAQISDVEGNIQSQFNQFYKHISFTGDNGIEIHDGNNSLTLTMDTDGISFKKNGEQFGFWDGNDFHTGNIVVEVNERAQFGNFAFVPRSDGSLMFLKVGG